MRRAIASFLVLFGLLVAPATFSYHGFIDVLDNNVYHDATFFMLENGYAQGYEGGIFLPFQDVNRVEALKMIMESAGIELSNSDLTLDFPDVTEDAWYLDYLKTGMELGIISGHDDGFMRPEDTVNRVEALKMLSIATGTELPEAELEWFTPYLDFGSLNNLILPNKYYNYLPGNLLNRGELSDIIFRFQSSPFTGEIEFGIASYYGDSFNGRGTASGAVLDTTAPMAAHLTLPFDTWVRVTNLATNQSVDVEILDRGPYVDGRVIDLTPSSFDEIGSLGSGILNVRVEVLK